MPFRMGPWEIALILVVILIIFGVGKLPQVGGALGKGLRAFRQGQRDEGGGGVEKAKGGKKGAKKATKPDEEV